MKFLWLPLPAGICYIDMVSLTFNLIAVSVFSTSLVQQYQQYHLEMGIEPINEGLGSVRFGRCYSLGAVRVRLILSSGSVRVRLIRVSQLRIWFGHSCNCKKLGALKKSNTCNKKHQTNDTESVTRQ